jgi:hypothetical protein
MLSNTKRQVLKNMEFKVLITLQPYALLQKTSIICRKLILPSLI